MQVAPAGSVLCSRRKTRLLLGASVVAFAAAIGVAPASAQLAAALRGASHGAGVAVPAPTPAASQTPSTVGMDASVARALRYQARVAAGVDLATQAQAAARAAAQALTSTVPNGLGAGGLDPVANPTTSANDPTGLHTWEGASAPTQQTTADGVTVTIDQTQARAVLSWTTFNVGADTTLTFNQKQNGVAQPGWVVLNRVVGQLNPVTGLRDPGSVPAPSQILGAIKADGTVLVLNQNGVLFGGGSQINVHSLVATSLEVGRAFDLGLHAPLSIRQRDDEFLNFGLLGYADQASIDQKAAAFTFSAQAVDAAGYDPTPEGAVTVQAGAEIATDSGGFLLLAGPKVVNAGHITSPDGQVSLQSGRQIVLQRSTGAANGLDPNVRGFVVSSLNRTDAAGNYVDNQASGLIEAARGYVSLGSTDGGAVIDEGVLSATTSVARNGYIKLSGGDIKVAPGATISITPDAGGETIPQDPLSLDAFKPSKISIGGAASRIEIGADAMIYAPGADISVGADTGPATVDDALAPGASRIFIDAGATIDAAGLTDVLIPASRNSLLIRPVKRNELRDTPNYKDGFLNGAAVYVDPRLSGVRADGVAWVGSPLIEAESYYQQVGVTAAELMTKGGHVSLGVASASGPGPAADVVLKAGSNIDISGGWVRYQAGPVQTTKLIDVNGQVVDISDADPNDTYIGVYAGFTKVQPRWGVSETWTNPLLMGARYEGDYTEGRDAGSLTIKASSAALDGTIFAGAFAGARQIADARTGTAASGVYGDLRKLQGAPSQLPNGGFLFIQALGLDANGNVTGGGDIAVTGEAELQPLPGDLGYGQSVSLDGEGNLVVPVRDPLSLIPDARRDVISLSAGALSNMGLGQISLRTSGAISVSSDAQVDLAPGAVFDGLAGRAITIDGSVSAPSGTIRLETVNAGVGSIFNHDDVAALGSFDIVVNGELSTRGRWVNDFGAAADALQGSAYLNGGSISLTAAPRVSLLQETATVADSRHGHAPSENVDISGSILVNAGARLDVSGGGYVRPDGSFDLSARGGNLSLINQTTYFQLTDDVNRAAGGLPGFRVNGVLDGGGTAVVAVNPSQINARVQIADGAILAHGFAGGGTFTLDTPEFSFGDGPVATGTQLPLDFFSRTGFANYNITSYKTALIPNAFSNGLGGYNAVLATQTLEVGAGQTLSLTQSMFSPVLDGAHVAALQGLQSGGDLYSVMTPQVPADAWDRKAANLSLGGLMELHVDQGGAVQGEAGGVLAVSQLFNEGTIRIAGGIIKQSEILPALYTGSNVVAVHDLSQAFTMGPDGSIRETAPNAAGLPHTTNAQLASQRPIYLLGDLDAGEGVRLAAGSVTDLSGEAILNPRAKAPGRGDSNPLRTGIVVAGGTLESLPSRQTGTVLFHTPFGVSVYAGHNPTGVQTAQAIDAVPGALIDLSGASDTFDLPTQAGFAPTPVWSNGGTLLLGNGGTLTGADIRAGGGAEPALGGTLILLDPTLSQDDPDAPTANVISAAAIGQAGFDTFEALGSLSSIGDVTLHLRRGFFLASRPYGGLAGQDLNTPGVRDSFAPTVRSGGVLEIDAPYIAFDGDLQSVSTPALGAVGTNSAIFRADQIDMRGAVVFDRSISSLTLDATGDLRLIGVQPFQLTYGVGDQTTPNSLAGQLVASGDVAITAAQVYPTTGSRFSITSAAADGTISFARSAGSTPATPYSAGGNLLVQAANIVQGGVLRAPIGKLTIGADTALGAFAPATQSVRLTDGSVSSVSADGLVIPYGTTTDQIEWFFTPTSGDKLTAPPAAVLDIGGASVALESGSTVNVSGGGDLYAYEFISGVGGSHDVLDRFNTDAFSADNGLQYPDGRQVYAIVPGLSDATAAAYDPIYSADYGDLYGASGAGKRVYLSAAPGLAAGWYTLLPAKYALLPGAMRVVEQTGAKAAPLGANGQLKDGSLVVTGYYGVAGTDAHDSSIRTFQVQSQGVFRKYSNIALTYANAKFAADAAHAGVAVPRLPMDAGRLIFDPVLALNIGTAPLTAAGEGGRGAQVDISGSAFDIVSALPETPVDGAITLTADSLTNLNAASLLIGGVRTDNADGTTSLNIAAHSITVENDAGHPLSGAETLLAVDGSGSSITLADGAAITATGAADDDRSGAYLIDGAQGHMTGAGAFVRVSAEPERLVQRLHPDAVAQPGALNIGAAHLDGQSILLNSSGGFGISGSADISAGALALGAGKITFASDPAGISGLVITPTLQALFGQADHLTLQTPGVIDFSGGDYSFGDLSLDSAGLHLTGGDVTITAGQLALSDSGPGAGACAADGALACTGDILSISAKEIDFGSGSIGVYVAGSVTLAATAGVFAQGKGAFDAGSAQLSLHTPFLGDRASGPVNSAMLIPSLAITTTGDVAISNPGGATVGAVAGAPGATLSISGHSVSVSGSRLTATAGTLDIQSATGITLSDGAKLETPGYAKVFGDAGDPVSVSAPGGVLRLTAMDGDIDLAAGATLSVGGGAGAAGTLDLSAGQGQVNLAGTLDAAAPDGGGSFRLDSGGAFDLAAFEQQAGRAFNGVVDIATGAGDLTLAAGQTIRAQDVRLAADGGRVDIAGTIDVSGAEGGDVGLYGIDGMALRGTAKIDAHADGYAASDTRQAKAGTVELGVDGTGAISVESGAVIDVSARRAGDRLVPMTRDGEVYYTYVAADQGGVVGFRAPVIEQPGADTVNVAFAGSVVGAREIDLEGFKRFDLAAVANDPRFVGVTLNAQGQAVLDVGAVAGAGQLNFLADNGAGTLVEFVQDFDVSADYANLGGLASSPVFHARPGMELDHGGDVVLASNWNLGAGSVDVAGAVAAGLMAELPTVPGKFYILPGKESEVFARFTRLTYRTGGAVDGEPGVLTLRAGGTLDIKGGISDGFFQFHDQTDPDFLNMALGGGDKVYTPFLGPGCLGGVCAAVGDWHAGDLPPSYVIIPIPSSTGLQGQLIDPAPYSAAANSPAGLGSLPGGAGDPFGSAELFPRLQTADGSRPVDSTSYRLVAGADLAAADPMRTAPGATGNVVIEGESSYTFAAVRGTSAFGGGLQLRAGSQLVSADQWLDAFMAANPSLDPNAYTNISFTTAPIPVKSFLTTAAADFFAAHPGQYQLIGPAGAPTGISTTLALAAQFMSEVVAPNFAALESNYRAPTPNPITAPTTATTRTLVRTGTGSIAVAAAGDIDLRNGDPVFRNLSGVVTPPSRGGIQVGGTAIYTAGARADLSARTVAGNMLLDASPYASASANLDALGGYHYGAGSAPDSPGAGYSGILVADPVYAEGGGDVSLEAGRDVLGRRDLWQAARIAKYQDGVASAYTWIGAADQPWRSGAVGGVTNILINPELFGEGVGALGGGDVRVRAGRDVSDITVAADTSVTTADVTATADPLSITQALWTFGGGDVDISAGRDLLGGRLDVGSGAARVEAGRDIRSAGQIQTDAIGTQAANTLRVRLTDAAVAIEAGNGVDIQGIAALGVQQASSKVQNNLDARGFFSAGAQVSILADGAVVVENKGADVITPSGAATANTSSAVYPGGFEAASLTGDLTLVTTGAPQTAVGIVLYPSPTGNLRLFAGGDIGPTTIAMEDGDPGLLPGIFSTFAAQATSPGVLNGRTFLFPAVLPDTPDTVRAALHNRVATHAEDAEPARIYAGGDIEGMIVSLPKQARIGAGRDIVDMMFFGQNLASGDITRITAGRDIIATTRLTRPLVTPPNGFGEPLAALQGNTFVIGGPGSFFLEAGRDAGPFLNSANTDGYGFNFPSITPTGPQTYGGGVLSVGDAWNPWLPQQGADLYIEFGVGKGANFDGFRDAYLDPANLANLDGDLFEQVTDVTGISGPDRSKPIYGPVLVKWMQDNAAAQLQAAFGSLDVTYEQAYQAFTALPELRQRVFILDQVYFNELIQTSIPTGPSYQQYSRGYRAVNTLFPAELGYTRNDLTGGAGGAEDVVETGDLDLRLATLQTSQGGNISILGPGGRVLAGSTVRTSEQAARRAYDGGSLFAGGVLNAPLPAAITSIPVGYEGVLTLAGGAIRSFTDGDFLLNQSRLFSQAGGDVAMWSSNGDLNAGQGPKTSANFPPVVVRIDEDLLSRIDAAGGVSGAGIAAFEPAPGVPAPNVYLIAPRGAVDAGDAGVRVSGSLFIAALTVVNANNFSVGGASFGVPTAAAVDVGAQAGAGAASGAASQAAQAASGAANRGSGDDQSIITVNVLGYAGADAGDKDCEHDGPGGTSTCPPEK